jgi:hypothetical protein
MEKFATLEEVEKYQIESGIAGAVIRALRGEKKIAHPQPYDPDKQGSIWLLRPTDNDATVSAVFCNPLPQISFDRVRYHPEDEHFLCHLVRNNSCCDTLVVPDVYWLDDDWREWLHTQL